MEKSTKISTSKLIVQYPPDFNGELHITVEREMQGVAGFSDTFTFTRFGHGTAKEKLVQCAKDIIRQFGTEVLP